MNRKKISPEQLADPSFLAGNTLAAIANSRDKLGVPELMSQEIGLIADEVKNGDLSGLEAVLTSQVLILNLLFNDLVTKGTGSLLNPDILSCEGTRNYPKIMLNTALRAQSQCRATIQAIAELKNPKQTTFIKNQLNAVKMEIEEKIEQLAEEIPENAPKMDEGGERKAIEADSRMETLAALYRSENPRGEADLLSELP